MPGLTGWVRVSWSRNDPLPRFAPFSDATIGRVRAAVPAPHGRRATGRRPGHAQLPDAVEVAAQPYLTFAAGELGCGREPNQRRSDVEPETLAARDRAAARALERVAHRAEARLRRPVRVVDARLPAEARMLVLRVEEQHADDVRLAEGEPEPTLVVGRLLRLRDRQRRRRLRARVVLQLALRDLRLDPELVVQDRQRRARLRRAVERLAEQPHELVVVGEADRRDVRMPHVGRLRRVVRIRVEREPVHHRGLAAAGAVGGRRGRG